MSKPFKLLMVEFMSVIIVLSLIGCISENPSVQITSVISTTFPTSIQIPTRVQTPTETKEPTITPTSQPTETQQPSPTVETEAPEPNMIEMDKTELNIGGRQIEFIIGNEENADIFDYWKSWGISGFGINRNSNNYQDGISNLVGASLWQAYMAEGGRDDVTYEEFVANPDKYKINLTRPNGDGFETTSFSLADVKRLEYRFIHSGYYDRLYMEDESILSTRFGFKMRKDGILIVYTCYGGFDKQLDVIQKFTTTELRPYIFGAEIGKLHHQLIAIGFTPWIASPLGYQPAWGNFFSRIAKVESLVKYPNGENCDSTLGVDKCKDAKGMSVYYRDYGYYVTQ